jgi:hypothetical protein
MAASKWKRFADELEGDLPRLSCERRWGLLLRVLEEWDRTDLKEHLSRDTRKTIRERIKKLNIVAKRARHLSEALEKLDEKDRSAIMFQIIGPDTLSTGAGTLSLEERSKVNREKWADQTRRLTELKPYLLSLGSVEPKEIWKLKSSRRPPNLTAYLVLQDAAAIFEWLTGVTATRQVDRDDGTETGPFFQFAETLWPVIFEKRAPSLSNSLKNWAEWRSDYNERSALIDSIASRHPAWGIFE